MIRVARRYRFPAAHVLASRELPDVENRRIFGKCANPNGHGHDYAVEVGVRGPVDPETGQVIPVSLLDAIFEERVARVYSHRFLNDCEGFEGCVPTAENIARVIHDALAPEIARRSRARLAGVRIIETARNTAEYGDTG